MPTTVFAVENLLSVAQFPSHVVAAEEAASGYEAFRVANGRRSGQDYWTPTTSNSDTWLKVTCDQVRAADFVALDRGHNLAGYTVRIDVSDDDFTTYQTAFSGVLPAATAPGSLDDALGVRTEEGAWLKRFDLRSGKYWRLFVPAMGSSLKPQVVGLWLGKSWELARGLTLPVVPRGADIVAELIESAAGWQGRGRATPRQAGTLSYRCASEIEGELAEYHLDGQFGLYRPAWLVHDTRRADRARLVIRTQERLGGQYGEDWTDKLAYQVAYVEHEAQAV